MHLELVRIVADWLRDPTEGVNALLPGIPREPDDPMAPTAVAIEDETTQLDPATRRQHQELADPAEPWPVPVLSVLSSSGATSDDDQPTAGVVVDAHATILICYFTAEPDAARAVRYSSYTLRATMQSLRRLLNAPQARRERNGVALWYGTGLQMVAVEAQRNDIIATSALMARYAVRDMQPTG